MSRISPKASIGADVSIADTAVIGDNVVIGDGCRIEHFCVIGSPVQGEAAGRPLVIGARAIIRSHSVLYEGSTFDDGLMVGHHAMIRDGVIAGRNLQIGSFDDLEGDTRIGDWVRFHSNVHIGRGTTIGDLVWVFPGVVTTNDPAPPSGLQIGAELMGGSVVCTGSVVLPGTRLGTGAFVAAMSRAKGDVPAGALFAGNPGRVVGSVRRVHAADKQHPWMGHFAGAYPPEAQRRIAEIAAIVDAACDVLDATA